MSEISEFIVSPSESKGDDIGQKGHHHNLSEVTGKELEDNSMDLTCYLLLFPRREALSGQYHVG